ncbi:MAG TPA: hypothetical protein VEA59_01310 [Patescibacteria group bacterium]|nr:hypothetical protein [Patescibacteria group bacterium]
MQHPVPNKQSGVYLVIASVLIFLLVSVFVFLFYTVQIRERQQGIKLVATEALDAGLSMMQSIVLDRAVKYSTEYNRLQKSGLKNIRPCWGYLPDPAGASINPFFYLDNYDIAKLYDLEGKAGKFRSLGGHMENLVVPAVSADNTSWACGTGNTDTRTPRAFAFQDVKLVPCGISVCEVRFDRSLPFKEPEPYMLCYGEPYYECVKETIFISLKFQLQTKIEEAPTPTDAEFWQQVLDSVKKSEHTEEVVKLTEYTGAAWQDFDCHSKINASVDTLGNPQVPVLGIEIRLTAPYRSLWKPPTKNGTMLSVGDVVSGQLNLCPTDTLKYTTINIIAP